MRGGSGERAGSRKALRARGETSGLKTRRRRGNGCRGGLLLPAVLPAVSGSASRFLTRWGPVRVAVLANKNGVV